jgi:UDP-glucose 4-epimerase
MKIAITGSKGYIGSQLVKKLKDKNQDVCLLDIDEWDIRTEPANNDFINFWQSFDVVVHLAALVKVGESVNRPWDYYNTNINGTQNILKYFSNAKMIFASTGAAFNPTSPYAKSKVAAEDLIRNQCKEYTIFRFFNVGGGKPSNPEGLYAATLNACTSGIFTINGNDYNTKDGTCVRDYVHVNDLCDAIIRAIHEPGAMTEYEPIGSGKSYTVLEYVNAFLEENGPKFNVEFGPRREGDNELSEVPFMSKFMNPQKTLKDIVKL